MRILFTEHSEETSSSYRKPDWVIRMEELKNTIQGRENECSIVTRGLQSDVNAALSQSTIEEQHESVTRRLLTAPKGRVLKKPLARNISVSSLKSTSPASSTFSVMPNSSRLSVNTSVSSESLGRNSSLSQDSSGLNRFSQSEIYSSEFGSGTNMGSTDETNTTSSRTDQMGFAFSCASLGDLSMGSDSVFVSETDTVSDIASRRGLNLNASRSHPTKSELEYIQMPPVSPSIKHVHFKFDGDGKKSEDNFAQSVLTDYLSSHRNSISQFIESLSNGSSETETKMKNYNSQCNQDFIPMQTSELDESQSYVIEQTNIPKEIINGISSDHLPNMKTTEIDLSCINENVDPANNKLTEEDVLPNVCIGEGESSNTAINIGSPTSSCDIFDSSISQIPQPRIASLNIGSLKPFEEKISATIQSTATFTMSAPTTPTLKRRNTVSSISGHMRIIDRNQNDLFPSRDTQSCQASPCTTPLISRKRIECGSLSKIPIVLKRDGSCDMTDQHKAIRITRSASEPASPMPSPMLKRRNSKIPILIPSITEKCSNKKSEVDSILTQLSSRKFTSGRARSSSEKSFIKSPVHIKPIWGSPINRTLSLSRTQKPLVASLPSTPVISRRSKAAPGRTLSSASQKSSVERPTVASTLSSSNSQSVNGNCKNIISCNQKIQALPARSREPVNYHREISRSCSSVPSSPNLRRSNNFSSHSAKSPNESTSIEEVILKERRIAPLDTEIHVSLPDTGEIQEQTSSQESNQLYQDISSLDITLPSNMNKVGKSDSVIFDATTVSNMKLPQPITTFLDIVNIKNPRKNEVDDIISYCKKPLFEDRYIMSVRRKVSTNQGLQRADSLEEFLTLESECMTGRK